MHYLVQDIEAIPTSELAHEWKPTEEEIKKGGEKGPFPPIWAFKVLTIGMVVLDDELRLVNDGCALGGCSAPAASEHKMIERWAAVASGDHYRAAGHKLEGALRLVDWNGRGFDMPVLQMRSFRYGVRLPWYFGPVPDNRGQISKYSKGYRDRYAERHIDLGDAWTNYGAARQPHMATLAQLMGLPGKAGFDGSQVHQAYKDGKLKEIDLYVMHDVYQTAFIFMRYKFMTGGLSIDGYRVAAQALLDRLAKRPEHSEFYSAIKQDVLLLQEEVPSANADVEDVPRPHVPDGE